MERAIPAPAIRLEIPIQCENVSRIQLLGELNQARIGEVWSEIAILAQAGSTGRNPSSVFCWKLDREDPRQIAPRRSLVWPAGSHNTRRASGLPRARRAMGSSPYGAPAVLRPLGRGGQVELAQSFSCRPRYHTFSCVIQRVDASRSLVLVAANSRAVALVFIFFSCSEGFLRSSLGPGWRELPIFDCRLPIADGHGKELPHHFFNRQSAISNRQSWPVLVAANSRAVALVKTSALLATNFCGHRLAVV